MGRTSKRFSILSHFSIGPEANIQESKTQEVVKVTGQFLPFKQEAVLESHMTLQKAVPKECIHARLLLLSPFPHEAPPFAKSVAWLSSGTGSVNVEVYRLSGAENHFFRLYVVACSSGVSLKLPPLFRGVISIVGYRDAETKDRMRCAPTFYKRVRQGLIRFEGRPTEDDDEIYIHAVGKIDLQLMDEDSGRPEWTGMGRLRRIILRKI
ncbi:hypothetical protein SERLA73DRAFT_76233 [Serpula lacrymans var. lacrymans S7.3]|uniref:Uncharacterized protein n=2 Tax=Serpula lacrymans var. lacrymans TaxID=341189 RepID=F8Q6L6_SERL3|nr:hypothetical protein SERLA73DRAFT_76233 [Serpula lacrymans var. lacrymans S7.3]